MHSLETLNLEQLDALMADLRTRQKALKSSGKGNQRKIAVLARRRERLFTQINAIDEQIVQLRSDQPINMEPVLAQRQTRRGQTQVSQSLEAILECVKNHIFTKRATIIDECHLSPANASIYLRQLYQEGKLIRIGDKGATTYSLP